MRVFEVMYLNGEELDTIVYSPVHWRNTPSIKRNLEKEFDDVATTCAGLCRRCDVSTTTTTTHVNECAICLDDIIGDSNFTVTECGHHFHTSCMLRNFCQRAECPMCRKMLVDLPEEDDDDEIEYVDEGSDSDNDEEDEDEDDDELPPVGDAAADNGYNVELENMTCRELADKLMAQGYTMADILFYGMGYRHVSERDRLNDALDDEIAEAISKIINSESEATEESEAVESAPEIVEVSEETETVVDEISEIGFVLNDLSSNYIRNIFEIDVDFD